MTYTNDIALELHVAIVKVIEPESVRLGGFYNMKQLLTAAFGRIIAVAAVVMVGALAASANEISLGGPTGLTAAYVTGGGCMSASCVSGSSTRFLQYAYNNALFGSAVNGATPVTGPSTSGGTQLTVTDPTNGDVTFNMISQAPNSGQNSAMANFWGDNSAALSDLVVPVGVLAVDDAWTMLNDYEGTTASSNITVSFYFGAASNTPLASDTELTFTLNPNQEVRSAVDCAGSVSGCPSTQPNSLIAADTMTAVCSGVCAGVGTSYTVTTGTTQAFGGATSAPYTSLGAGQPDTGSSGSIVLDDQEFQFGSAFASEYLVAMEFQDRGTSLSHAALSAITVDSTVTADSTTTTPEPSAILLMFGGLTGVAFLVRRKATA